MATKTKKQEKEIASLIKGKRCPASGAFYWAKSDAVSKKFRAECKLTEGKSIRITVEMIKKISKEAFQTHRDPLLAVRFENIEFPYDKDWLMLPARLFKELLTKEE